MKPSDFISLTLVTWAGLTIKRKLQVAIWQLSKKNVLPKSIVAKVSVAILSPAGVYTRE